MSLIDKAYFTLEELEERWQLPHRDVAYLAKNGLLRLSVRLFGVGMEFGVYEEGADGEWFTVPHERRRFTGFQDLLDRDVFRLFRQGQVDVVHFHAPEKEYCYLIEPTRIVTVCRDDVLVRREERDRVADLSGITFIAKIKVDPSDDPRYGDQNRLDRVVLPTEKEWKLVMDGKDVPARPGRQRSTIKNTPPQPMWSQTTPQAVTAKEPPQPQTAAAKPWSQPQASAPAAKLSGPSWLNG